MLPRPFFHDPVFGWTFYAVVVVLTAIAAYTDLRTAIVPKWVTLSTLAFGILFNVVRGCLLGAADVRLWVLPTGSGWLGGLDGLLFALAGFAVGFALFFGMWVLGTCGGGDVKLMAALGAWVGPLLIILIMLGSAAVLTAFVVVRVFSGGLSPKALRARMQSLPMAAKRTGKTSSRKPKWRMTYSLPVALATAALLLWFFRAELHLDPRKPADNEKVHTDVN